jgi:hypothetical protein
MNTQQGYVHDSLTRGKEFLGGHETELGPLKDTEGGRQLDVAVTQIEAHRLGQKGAEIERQAAMARKKALAVELKQQHMKPIAKFARAKLPGVPDFAALAESGHGLRGRQLVTAARAKAKAMEPVVAVFVEAQFPADVVEQLNRAADALEKALSDHATKKIAKGVATASLRQHLKDGRQAVAMLDPIVTKKLAGNAGLLEGWRQAKRVVKKPGVVARADEATAAPVAVPVVPAVPVATVSSIQPALTGSSTSDSTPAVEKVA